MQHNTPEREIDIMRMLYGLWRRIWVIIGSALVVGLATFLFTYYFVTPMYRANVSLYVDNRSRTELTEQYVSSSSLSTAQRLVKTYMTFIESNTVLEEVAQHSGLGLSVGQIRKMLSASSVDDTEVFRVYITSDDPQTAATIANSIAEVAPERIGDFLVGSSTKVIDYANVPTSPVSPNYQRNILLGALAGVLLSCIVICVVTILDIRIEDEEELERLFDRPVLGSIPSFDLVTKSGGKYGKKKEGYGYSYPNKNPGQEDK